MAKMFKESMSGYRLQLLRHCKKKLKIVYGKYKWDEKEYIKCVWNIKIQTALNSGLKTR